MTYPRRSDTAHAGRMCAHASTTHVCTAFARYYVKGQTTIRPTGEIDMGTRVCGAHLPAAIRDTWTKSKAAAIVQEIPGMWRDRQLHNGAIPAGEKVA